jgi:hypothetical protein
VQCPARALGQLGLNAGIDAQRLVTDIKLRFGLVPAMAPAING